MPINRRFQPPWSIENAGATHVMKDSADKNLLTPIAGEQLSVAERYPPFQNHCSSKRPSTRAVPVASLPRRTLDPPTIGKWGLVWYL
jgi:hypothetical protein